MYSGILRVSLQRELAYRNTKMRERKDRVFRLIAGALLGSDLTRKELTEISERLLFDLKWTEKMATYLREIAQVSESLPRGRTKDVGYRMHERPEVFANELAELFSRKRVRKDEALEILRKISKSENWMPNSEQTVRENCHSLIQGLSNPNNAISLVDRVASALGIESDPYLRGLS